MREYYKKNIKPNMVTKSFKKDYGNEAVGGETPVDLAPG